VGRRLHALVAAVAATLASAPAAHAATVTLETRAVEPHPASGWYCDPYAGGCQRQQTYDDYLRIVASPGEANEVTVVPAEPDTWSLSIRIRDPAAPLELQTTRCSADPADPHAAVCGYADGIEVELRDGDDRLDWLAHGSVEIDGGDGDDVLSASTNWHWGAGVVAGGAGADTIHALRADGGPGPDRIVAHDDIFGARLAGGPDRDVIHGGDGPAYVCGATWLPTYTWWRMSDDWQGQEVEWSCPEAADGDDILSAGPGGAELVGGAGADVLTGGPRVDRFDAGSGSDAVYATRDPAPETDQRHHFSEWIFLGAGDDVLDTRDLGPDDVQDCGEGVDRWQRDADDRESIAPPGYGSCEDVDPPLERAEPVPAWMLAPWDPYWEPMPPSSGQQGDAPPQQQQPPVRVSSARLAGTRSVAVRVACRRATRCAGRMSVGASRRTVSAPRSRLAGSRRYAVPARATRTLRVRVPARVRESLARSRRAFVRVAAGRDVVVARVRLAR
jgi:hypothetical protein